MSSVMTLCHACRYLQDDQPALHSLLEAENMYAKAWLQPLAKLQRQLHREIMQASPQRQVSIPLKHLLPRAVRLAVYEAGQLG